MNTIKLLVVASLVQFVLGGSVSAVSSVGIQSSADSSQVTADSTQPSEEPAKKYANVYVMAELVGSSLGWVSGIVEVPVYRSLGAEYSELGLSAGIGSIQPLNGYVTSMVKYSWGRKHRLELGAGPSFLYERAPAPNPDIQPSIQPLSDAPVNVSSLIGYKHTGDTGFIFRAFLVAYFDTGQRSQLLYIWPTISIGLAF